MTLGTGWPFGFARRLGLLDTLVAGMSGRWAVGRGEGASVAFAAAVICSMERIERPAWLGVVA